MSDSAATPMMQQYWRLKEEAGDAVLLFRLGDFYEMFGEDAELAAQVLEITLTSRETGKGKRIPMCGVPHHSADGYIAKLVSAGYKVAIGEQVEDPKESMGVVRREIVRIITPGTLMNEDALTSKGNNYLCLLHFGKVTAALAYVDLSTGEFAGTELPLPCDISTATERSDLAPLLDELSRLSPAELVLAEGLEDAMLSRLLQQELGCHISFFSGRWFNAKVARRRLEEQFEVASLAAYDLEDRPLLTTAAGALLAFLEDTQRRSLSHISAFRYYSNTGHMLIDATTARNLELTARLIGGDRRGSLLWLLDRTVTAMGGRLLRQWLLRPLLDVATIRSRQDAIEQLYQSMRQRLALRAALERVYDIERLTGKCAYGSANARDLASLRDSLRQLPRIVEVLRSNDEDCQSENGAGLLDEIAREMDLLPDLLELLEAALVDEPPISVREGGILKDGYNQEVDRLRLLQQGGKDWILALEEQERERTGIKSLKVGFNKVFGYYIEVTKANLHLVPEEYQRKQTLANAERYITPELKQKEAEVLAAEEKVVELEYEIFCSLRDHVARDSRRLQATAHHLALLDVCLALAEVANERGYTRPVVDESDVIMIKDGRHPVVEASLPAGRFVPNDCELNTSTQRLIILTGPNMGGKSTYLRQVALIVLLAHIGSFVPAAKARIGLVDRIFTRVGAADDLGTGQSTFMIEMNETANLVHASTDRSLIVIDELGRGTSTYDGVALAQATAEYLHNVVRAKTIISTHYHELTALGKALPGAVNLHVAVQESADQVTFLYRVVPGPADKSYGINVARMAGLPSQVVDRARQVQTELEAQGTGSVGQRVVQPTLFQFGAQDEFEVAAAADDQGPLTTEGCIATESGTGVGAVAEEVLAILRGLNLNTLTPLEALQTLFELQALLKDGADDR